jgi:hypothetical protein
MTYHDPKSRIAVLRLRSFHHTTIALMHLSIRQNVSKTREQLLHCDSVLRDYLKRISDASTPHTGSMLAERYAYFVQLRESQKLNGKQLLSVTHRLDHSAKKVTHALTISKQAKNAAAELQSQRQAIWRVGYELIELRERISLHGRPPRDGGNR